MLPDRDVFEIGWKCVCPRCKEASIFKPGLFSFQMKSVCDVCGLNIDKADSADGPAVFLIFILGFILAPGAVVLDMLIPLPVWVHAVLWSFVALAMTLLSLKQLTAYVIAIQYKYRPEDFKTDMTSTDNQHDDTKTDKDRDKNDHDAP